MRSFNSALGISIFPDGLLGSSNYYTFFGSTIEGKRGVVILCGEGKK